MKVVYNEEFNIPDVSSKNCCSVHLIHVQIDDIDIRAKEMIERTLDTSWLNKMDVVDKIAFTACSERTIRKFVEEILNEVHGDVDIEFGEIMISDTAQCVLKIKKNHKILPLADLIKERVSGNGGFDFHTESQNKIAVYGEAKYSGSSTRYADALKQINNFIDDEKDIAELITIQHFISAEACKNVVANIKGYTAAFSIHAKNPKTIFDNAIKSSHFVSLLKYKEIYLIGVEVCE